MRAIPSKRALTQRAMAAVEIRKRKVGVLDLWARRRITKKRYQQALEIIEALTRHTFTGSPLGWEAMRKALAFLKKAKR